jgi:hypothetical protein
MKKLIVAFVVLIILGGVVFYFGWIQLQLQENTYAVIFTKTGGWDEEVTEPGTFVWRWERLLPTNFSMHTFTLVPYTARVSSGGVLPGAEVYEHVLDPPPEFAFSLELSVDFGIRPSALAGLVADALLTEETFDTWHAETAEIISARAAAYVREQSTRGEFASQLTHMGDPFTSALIRHLDTTLPYVDIKGLTIRELRVPDFELYQVAKEIYIDLALKRKESHQAALDEITWTEQRSTQHFDVIERYGELITKYPTLLELFSLKEGELGSILEEIDAFTPQSNGVQ